MSAIASTSAVEKDIDVKKTIEKLAEFEELSQNVAAYRRNIAELAQKRHQTCEALRALRKSKKQPKNKPNSWICFNHELFIKLPNDMAEETIQEDLDKLDQAIAEARKELKTGIDQMKSFEFGRDLEELGYNIKAINFDEDC